MTSVTIAATFDSTLYLKRLCGAQFQVFNVTHVALWVKERTFPRSKNNHKLLDISLSIFDSSLWKESLTFALFIKSGLGAIYLQFYLLIIHISPDRVFQTSRRY